MKIRKRAIREQNYFLKFLPDPVEVTPEQREEYFLADTYGKKKCPISATNPILCGKQWHERTQHYVEEWRFSDSWIGGYSFVDEWILSNNWPIQTLYRWFPDSADDWIDAWLWDNPYILNEVLL